MSATSSKTGGGTSVPTATDGGSGDIQQITSTGGTVTVTAPNGPITNLEVTGGGLFPGFDVVAPPSVAAASAVGTAPTAARGDHTHLGVHSATAGTSLTNSGTATDPVFNVTPSAVDTQSVATFAALGALASATFVEGTAGYVQSAKAWFLLMLSAAAARTNYRIAASGKAGYQWVRVPMRSGFWEVQATWFVDPTNTSGTASDDNSGLNSGAPLLTFQECAWRLASAEINQATSITYGPGNQQAGDVPTWSYLVRQEALLTLQSIPTVVYSSTVTSYTAQATTTAADDNEFVDAAVPGGSFTAAGALAQGVLLKRTNSTAIYAVVIKDLGSTTARVGQPCAVGGGAPVAFSAGDTYQLISLPQLISWSFAPGACFQTKFSNVTWNVPATTGMNGANGATWQTSYIQRVIRPSGQRLSTFGCCWDLGAGGGSMESGGPVVWQIGGCSFKGTGATRYTFAGNGNSELTVTSLQGCQILIENGTWNLGQVSVYDSGGFGAGTAGAIATGTGARAHFLAPISGKNNTGKLASANQASQIVVQGLTVTAGSFFTAASTTDVLPIQAGATTSAVAIPLDANMNGVFTTL